MVTVVTGPNDSNSHSQSFLWLKLADCVGLTHATNYNYNIIATSIVQWKKIAIIISYYVMCIVYPALPGSNSPVSTIVLTSLPSNRDCIMTSLATSLQYIIPRLHVHVGRIERTSNSSAWRTCSKIHSFMANKSLTNECTGVQNPHRYTHAWLMHI